MGTPIQVAEDFRWSHSISQIELVEDVVPHSRVSRFVYSRKTLRKFGHLATLDLLAYSSNFRNSFFFGFDGSLPATFYLTQPN